MRTRVLATILALMATGCGGSDNDRKAGAKPAAGSFAADLELLRAHTPTIVLASPGRSAQVAIAPAYQGRVMTSTAGGDEGLSFGYLHRPGIEAGTRQPHMTVLGGEDRFWLGPEGGQYALYFAPGSTFDADHWQVPEAIDWDKWPVASETGTSVRFQRDITLTNYSGAHFSIRVDRTVRLLFEPDSLDSIFGVKAGAGTRVVGYLTDNRVTNTGTNAWKKETGLVSIWILGMYRPGPQTTVVIPFVSGPESALGPIVNDKYFGKIDADRLRVTDRALFFRADGQKRGKIGVPGPRARDIAGSYDAARHVLTLVKFTLPDGANDYVNSMWEKQTQPYSGDVVNSYNDGPMTPGAAPMGPFYEIESSSPAAALAPGASIQHIHRTFHLEGPDAELDVIARAVLGVSLAEITSGKQ